MKSYNIKLRDILSDNNIRVSILSAARRKRKRKVVRYVLENIDEEIVNVRNIIISGNLELKKHNEFIIYDEHSKKERTIVSPNFKYEQIIHHIVINGIKKVLTKGMYKYSLASIEGRGTHMGAKRIRKWITQKKNIKYIFKMDIRHFFQSIDHDVIKGLLRKKFRDKDLLNIMFQIIDSYDEGLPLGFYTSHWLADFLLQQLDHYIKEELKIPHMMRYMDDIVLFSDNKKTLHKAHKCIETYLRDRLKLEIKNNYQVFRFDYICPSIVLSGNNIKKVDNELSIKHKLKYGKIYINKRSVNSSKSRSELNSIINKYSLTMEHIDMRYGRPLDFMGFLFFRDRVILRKHIAIRISKKARRFKYYNIPNVSCLLSYKGYLDCTDTYGMYKKYVKPYINYNKLKSYISKAQKARNQRVHNMEIYRRDTGTTAS